MQGISKTIIDWYRQNKRELPWRDIKDAYKIWISEIILQQTRVNQGMNYYLRFVKRFPDVKSLANADEEEVLRYWQGLGYYSRARNLHKAAHQIMDRHNGVFPTEFSDIITLPGIGVYTASAISSFAYNQPYAVVDGNVYRVLARYFGIETPIDTPKGIKQFAEMANAILDHENAGLHNQALMEFGALQCIPVSPDCLNCPLTLSCKAFENKLIATLPIKEKKVKVKERFFNYLFINLNENTFLQKRTNNDIWKNLYEFPLIETEKQISIDELTAHNDFIVLFRDIEDINIRNISAPVKHILTHRIIYATFVTIEIRRSNKQLEKLTKTSLSEVQNFAVSRLIDLFLQNRDK
jgi:A/G-specific adenine glycosylase